VCHFGSVLLWTTCFNKCVKRFFEYTKYDNVTDMFASLGIANAQSRLLSLNLNFANQLWRCHNPIISLLGSNMDIHLVLLTIRLVSRSYNFCYLLYYAKDLRCLK